MGQTILVVDDEARIVKLVRDYLERAGFDVLAARDGEMALTLARVPIIMLTARVEEADRIVGLELGADDYVTKPFSPGELVARVRATLRRASGEVGPSTILRAGDVELDTASLTATVADQPVDLTPTEFQLLATLLRQPGRIFSREQLLEAIHGVAFDGYDRSVDSHVKNLRRKIEPDPRQPCYVQTVYGVGYRFGAR
jgi:two-component system alkaline phosphatase synthesis response regulator PhoP